jgi:hypothetical protein
MLDKIESFMDAHPKLYLMCAGIMIGVALGYLDDAHGCYRAYREASTAAKEVSEALGG